MTVTLKLFDVVALTSDIPDRRLRRGQVGTIVEILSQNVFEIEFCDDNGRAYEILAVPADQLMVLHYRQQLA